MNRRLHPGFTIVELLIVIVVIGVLAAITIVAYQGMQQRATTAAISSAVDQWEKIIRMELAVSGTLPGSENNALFAVCLGGSVNDFPQTNQFDAGVCMKETQPSGTPDKTWSYPSSAFDQWQIQRPSGLLPTARTQIDQEYTHLESHSRGILLYYTKNSNPFLMWTPQVAGECVRGGSIAPDNGLSGDLCVLTID